MFAGALLVAPGVAAAAGVNYCVPSTSIPNCPAGGKAEPTITAALSASQTAGGHNAIYLGPQPFTESNLTDGSGNQVDIIGDGAGKTTITSSASAPTTVLTIDDASSTVRDLTIAVPAGSNNTGLSLGDAGASLISVTAASGATGAFGVIESGGTLTKSTVSLPPDATGVDADPGSVSDTAVQTGTGIEGTGTFARDRITATIGVTSYFLPVGGGSPTVEDSLIRTVAGTGNETAIDVFSGLLGGNSAGLVRHDTLIGDGSASSVGVSCTATYLAGPPSCTTTVDSTIIRGFHSSIVRTASNTGASANVTVDYSDFDPTNDVSTNSGSATGSITLGSHNLNVNPGFVSTTPSDPLAFQLTTPSPMIDKGTPTLGSGESTTDLAGAPRVVAGRVGATPRSDIGAFEYQPKAPLLSTRASKSIVAPRMKVTFTASATPVNPGDTVSAVKWSFDDGSTATGSSVTHAFSKVGRHTATASVTDLNGFRVSKTVSVTVEGKPSVSGFLSGLAGGHPGLGLKVVHGAGAPGVKSLSVGLPRGLGFSGRAFVTVKRCTRLGKHRKCTTITLIYGLSFSGGKVQSVRLRGGRLVITLKRPSNGVLVGARGPLLTESAALRKSVKKHKVRSLRATVTVTDANGTTTTFTGNLKPH